ncbi:ExeM/NucH family extracellular endonuclease [Photobacterium minamisatsumaniensis]|uniref:ExeM/NucH family extracellular endonuclease n=1 Tax=Photobacterium minamisatsumaniensis TaxID=2910233 RepID=UPI003D123680
MNLFRYSAVMLALIAPQVNADVFISQVVHAGSNSKAIEIANSGDQAVELKGYELFTIRDGVADHNKPYVAYALDGVTLESGEVWVLVRSDAGGTHGAELKKKASELANSQVLNFNGNDPITLRKNGQIIDIVGEMNGVEFLPRETWVRREAAWHAQTDYSRGDWSALKEGSIDYLGQLADPGDEPEPVEPDFDQVATIMELQGEGFHSPYTDPDNYKFYSDETFKVNGIVTYVQSSNGVLSRGFYIQDQQGGGNACASSGIFVHGATTGLSVGDKVDVYGKVQEYYGATQLSVGKNPIIKTGTGNIEPTALRIGNCEVDGVAEKDNFEITLERHEGMWVKLDKDTDMKVARTFGFDFGPFRNNMVASYGAVNYHPNQKYAPGSEDAIAVSRSNKQRRLFIESPKKAPNGVIPWYPEFGTDNGTGTTDDYIRVGATIDGMEGFIGFSHDEYRLFVTNKADASFFNHEGIERTEHPEVKEGDIKIGAFNVLNYFTSPFGGASNPLEQNRGADNGDDFQVQGDKLAAAMLAIDADIWSFLEVENNGYDYMSSIVEITRRLNEQLPPEKHYAIMRHPEMKTVGTDAISTKVIYRPTVVSLERAEVIEMPAQHVPARYWPEGVEAKSAFQRHSMTGVFTVNGNGERLILSSNHFKSKGSECWEDHDMETGEVVDADEQGQCENFRVSAAYTLAEALDELDGHKIILGDLNSYAHEDPIMLLTNSAPEGYEIKAARNTFLGGKELHGNDGALFNHTPYNYIDIIAKLHPDGFSYSYSDTVGNLDYALISPSLLPHVVDATEWNINSRESTLFEYPTKNTGKFGKYDDPFRSSDHDPAILTLDFLPSVKLGSKVQLPESPINMPSENRPSEGETFTAVVDLTLLNRAYLQVGEAVQVIIDDRNIYDVSTYSRSQIRRLSRADIQRGWVSIDLVNVGAGESRVTYLYNGQIVNDRQLMIKEKEAAYSGGAVNMLLLMALASLAYLRRRGQIGK